MGYAGTPIELCTRCGAPLGCNSCGWPAPLTPGDQPAAPAQPIGRKLEAMVRQLIDTNPADAGPMGAGLAIIRMAHAMKLTAPLLRAFPDLDDDVAWQQLLTMVVGVLLALPDEPIDTDSARMVGLALLEGATPGR